MPETAHLRGGPAPLSSAQPHPLCTGGPEDSESAAWPKQYKSSMAPGYGFVMKIVAGAPTIQDILNHKPTCF